MKILLIKNVKIRSFYLFDKNEKIQLDKTYKKSDFLFVCQK